MLQTTKVGIVHDWFPGPQIAGGERVIQEMVRSFPDSSVYGLFDFLTEAQRKEVTLDKRIIVSRLNSLPFVKKYYRHLLLACTRAIESFDLSHHELVLSSSASLAKGVITSPDQTHIAYVHSPARYAWDLTHEYVGTLNWRLKRMVAREMMHRFRKWDMRPPQSVDYFVANSNFIRKRIWKVYRREADVIYPPVNTDNFTLGTEDRQDHYVTISRLVPYKRIPMIAEAFALNPKLKLKVFGDGPELAALKAVAGPNVEVHGHLSFEAMKTEMQKAKAFIMAAKEDFGILPLEAQACGTPVIALGQGGTAETIRPLDLSNPTGIWFDEQTSQSLSAALTQFEAEGDGITAEDCRANALSFNAKRFRDEMQAYVQERVK